MANRLFKKGAMGLETGIVKLYGKVTTSTSGTVGSQSCKGFSVAKTGSETGRYTVTLEDKYNEFKGCCVTLIGTTDAAMTSAKGLVSFIRNEAVSTLKTFDIQFADPDGSPADAEVENAVVICLEITLKNSAIAY